MGSQWAWVHGYEDLYEVSNTGDVRRGVRVLKQQTTHDGYHRLTLSKKNVRKNVTVHRLVLEAFRGPCPEGMQCAHKNGKRDDNRLVNLRWATPESNQKDRITTKTVGYKLTPNEVLEVFSLRGVAPYSKVAQQFGISKSLVHNIWSGYRWSRVTQCKNKRKEKRKYLITQ